MTKRIKRNIEEFAKKLFDLISNPTQEGHGRLIEVFKKSHARYIQEGYMHNRLADFEAAISDLTAFPEPNNSIQTVLTFISEGGWEINSGNSILFYELIYATGYKPDKDETELYLQQQVIQELKTVLSELITISANEHKNILKEVEAKKLALRKMREVKPEDLMHVVLCDNAEVAGEAVYKYREKDIYCLEYVAVNEQDFHWQLSWYDLLGQPNFLPIGNELQGLLASMKKKQLPNPNLDIYDQLKVCCDKIMGEHAHVYIFNQETAAADFARNHPEKLSFCLNYKVDESKWQLAWYDLQGKPNYLICSNITDLLKGRTQLPLPETSLHYKIKLECVKLVKEMQMKVQASINPPPLKLIGLTSCFVISGKLPKIDIEWYDQLGVPQPIMLYKYPTFRAWLSKQDNLDETTLPQLKTFLMNLNIRRDVNEKKQANVLELLQKKHGVTLIATNDLAKVPKYKLIAGTYILMKEPCEKEGTWVLWQKQKKGANKLINTESWDSAYHDLLFEHQHQLPEDLSFDVKNTLREHIKNALKFQRKDRLSCVAVDEFHESHTHEFKPCSFALTKESELWKLYYLNSLQKPILVKLNECSAVQSLLGEWSESPKELSAMQLEELVRALGNYIPSNPLTMSKYKEVERCLSARMSSPANVANTPPSSTELTTQQPESGPISTETGAKAPVKLDLKNFQVITGFFGHVERPTQIEPEPTVEYKP